MPAAAVVDADADSTVLSDTEAVLLVKVAVFCTRSPRYAARTGCFLMVPYAEKKKNLGLVVGLPHVELGQWDPPKLHELADDSV